MKREKRKGEGIKGSNVRDTTIGNRSSPPSCAIKCTRITEAQSEFICDIGRPMMVNSPSSPENTVLIGGVRDAMELIDRADMPHAVDG